MLYHIAVNVVMLQWALVKPFVWFIATILLTHTPVPLWSQVPVTRLKIAVMLVHQCACPLRWVVEQSVTLHC